MYIESFISTSTIELDILWATRLKDLDPKSGSVSDHPVASVLLGKQIEASVFAVV